MPLGRWLAQLAGSEADLHYLPKLFPSGELFVLREGDGYYLAGARLDWLGSAEEVRDAAEAELDLVVAAAKLIVGVLNRPRVTGIYFIDSQGNRHAYAPGSVFNLEFRYKLTEPDLATQGGRTRAQRLAAGGKSHPALLSAMQLWADETRTWPRLYRVMEEVEATFGGVRVDVLGFCSANERQRFARSANSPAVAGLDARHADLGHEPPRKPMTLAQATHFVSLLLVAAIEKHNAPPASSGA
jgi:hypothetical protein